jgi:1-phosphatidylinositol-3-phosphate 5-kinase
MTSKALFFHDASLTQNDNDIVYLDQNYAEYMGSPIYIGGRTRNLLQHAIWNDTSFLTVSIKHHNY